ncbi:MAG: redox-sensing transcriptional repressor Rex [Planctomycetes bacterium]|nr:redox-sensing transcriptional repressor Rex [Planctomycetota bacterium]
MSDNYLSSQNVERLPRYFMIMSTLLEEGVKTVTSKELANYEGIDESLVRKDLSAVEVEGRKRVGYDVKKALNKLREMLGIDIEHRAVLVGVGHLGTALSNFNGFSRYNVKIVGLFDNDKSKHGKQIGKLLVQSMDKLAAFVKQQKANVGVVLVPATEGQIVTDKLVEAGVKSIWNFAPVPVNVPKEIYIRNENLAASLVTLTFWLTQKEMENRGDPNAMKLSNKSGRSKSMKESPINKIKKK